MMGLVKIMVEFYHHIRLSFFAVVLAMLVIAFWPTKVLGQELYWIVNGEMWNGGMFFHLFHYPHITFAAATSLLTIYRFSTNIFLAIGVSLIFPVVLCTLSDILLPYLGAKLLGITMDLHLCIACNLPVVGFFLLAGILAGSFLCWIQSCERRLFSITLITHFAHEFVSAIASLVYLVGFGFYAWQQYLLTTLVLMLVAVILPCMMSDFFVPLLVTKSFQKLVTKKFNCCER